MSNADMRLQASRDFAQRYVYLMWSTYRLANASSNMPILAAAILKFFSSVWKEMLWLSSQVSGRRVAKKTSRNQGPLLYCMLRRSWRPTFLKIMELTSQPPFPPYSSPSKVLINKFVRGSRVYFSRQDISGSQVIIGLPV